MEYSFAGLPIRETVPPAALGCPRLCIQFNYPHCFLMSIYYHTELAVITQNAVAVFRIHPKKK